MNTHIPSQIAGYARCAGPVRRPVVTQSSYGAQRQLAARRRAGVGALAPGCRTAGCKARTASGGVLSDIAPRVPTHRALAVVAFLLVASLSAWGQANASLPGFRRWATLTSAGETVVVPSEAISDGDSLIVFGDGSFQGQYLQIRLLDSVGAPLAAYVSVLGPYTRDELTDNDFWSGLEFDRLSISLSSIPAGKSVDVVTTTTTDAGRITDWMLARVPRSGGSSPAAPAAPSPCEIPSEPEVVRLEDWNGWPQVRLINPVRGQAMIAGQVTTDGSGYYGVNPRRSDPPRTVVAPNDPTSAVGGRGIVVEVDPAWNDLDTFSVARPQGRFVNLLVWGHTDDGETVLLQGGNTRGHQWGALRGAAPGRVLTHLIFAINIGSGSDRMGGMSFMPHESQADITFAKAR